MEKPNDWLNCFNHIEIHISRLFFLFFINSKEPTNQTLWVSKRFNSQKICIKFKDLGLCVWTLEKIAMCRLTCNALKILPVLAGCALHSALIWLSPVMMKYQYRSAGGESKPSSDLIPVLD